MTSAVHAGLMRETVVVEREQRTQRADGGFDVSWQVTDTLWAAVEPEQTVDAAIAGREAAPVRYKITVYNAAFRRIISGDRLVWQGIKLRLRSSPINPARTLRVTVLADVEAVQ